MSIGSKYIGLIGNYMFNLILLYNNNDRISVQTDSKISMFAYVMHMFSKKKKKKKKNK